MASDDDADDDGYDIEMDSSDETQLGAGAAGRRGEATGECNNPHRLCLISYMVYRCTKLLLGDA